jgi:anti-sigma factor RsiW
MGKPCQDYISDISDYIDGEIDATLCEQIEKHLGECENCRIMVDTLRQTVTLCRDGKEEPLPPVLEEKLKALLRTRWNAKFGNRD